MMTFSEAVKTCITKKFFTISGRASRAEYWWFVLLGWISWGVLGIGAALAQTEVEVIGILLAALGGLALLLMIIPLFCVCVRRLHDTGHSGWNILWGLIPIPILNFIGEIYLLILLCKKSESGENEYGLPPSLSNENFCTDNSSSPIKEENENEEITDVNL